MNTLSIKIAKNKDFKTALELLEKYQLPTSDISDNVTLYGAYQGDKMIGTIGIEAFNTEGLLRSVSVEPNSQYKGLGTLILQHFEAIVTKKGIKNLYLLTTTAKDFFQKNDYQVVSRDSVPNAIKQTSEFSSTCPSSATVMLKIL